MQQRSCGRVGCPHGVDAGAPAVQDSVDLRSRLGSLAFTSWSAGFGWYRMIFVVRAINSGRVRFVPIAEDAAGVLGRIGVTACGMDDGKIPGTRRDRAPAPARSMYQVSTPKPGRRSCRAAQVKGAGFCSDLNQAVSAIAATAPVVPARQIGDGAVSKPAAPASPELPWRGLPRPTGSALSVGIACASKTRGGSRRVCAIQRVGIAGVDGHADSPSMFSPLTGDWASVGDANSRRCAAIWLGRSEVDGSRWELSV